MQERILEELQALEWRENIRILYAAESGSRAWGFASKNSDYDVRFLYVRRMEDYLSILPKRDVIEMPISEDLDINGWDLMKALRLLLKSNPTLFEWTNSPIVYRTSPEWESLRPEINRYFSSRSGVMHYLSMAKSNYREYLRADTVPFKKYFYVIRPLLVCRHILKTETPPPMLFDVLVQSELEERLQSLMMELVERKRKSTEKELIPRIDVLNRYIEDSLEELNERAASMPSQEEADPKLLDAWFLRVVQQPIPD